MPIASIIVPVYGVEQYIERCARSLFAQTQSDLEFIFIDDCTPDNSMQVLQSVISKNAKRLDQLNWTVRTERMPANSGLPAVRAYGISIATGDFIIHCDSDDWVEPTMCEKLLGTITMGKHDIVFCDFYKDSGVCRSVVSRFKHFCSDARTMMRRMMLSQENGSVWGAAYRRSLYANDYTVPTGNMGEDLTANIQLLYFCQRSIGLVEEPLYHYFYNNASISRNATVTNTERNFRTLNQNIDLIDAFFNLHEPGNYSAERTALRLWACRPLTPLLGDKQHYRMWREKTDTIKDRIILNRDIPLSVRIHYLVSYTRTASIASRIKQYYARNCKR